MKKIFTLLFMSLALAANANDFTDDLALTVMGSTTTTETTVSVTQQENGNYTFTLPNLSVKVLVMTVNVGTVVISDIEGVDMGNGNVLLSAEKDIEIQEGDDESVTTWVGTTMGEVPVVFNAVMSEYELNAEMSLSMTYSGMSITAAATFGSAITDEYSGELVATILGAEITDTSTVYVENETDGTYTLTLKNFILTLAGEPMYVGTIHIPGITGTANNGVVEIASTQNITIDSGDDESQYWMGPYLGEVPVELDGTIGDGTIALTLSITAAIGTIGVEFNGSVPAGIQAVPATAVKNDTPYTLTGVKAPAGYKGIVIENGRKVLK